MDHLRSRVFAASGSDASATGAPAADRADTRRARGAVVDLYPHPASHSARSTSEPKRANMKTQHVPSSLRRSTSALEQLLLSLLLMPQLLVAAPGCTGIVDEAGNDEADAPSAASIFVYDPSKEGMVQSAMAAAGARFVTDGYETVIVNVDGSNTARLAPIVTQF